jgi:hypothetical protein
MADHNFDIRCEHCAMSRTRCADSAEHIRSIATWKPLAQNPYKRSDFRFVLYASAVFQLRNKGN